MIESSYKGLKKYCYFSGLSDGALEAISNKFTAVEFPAGSTIISEGAAADSFYLVADGEVEVLKNTKWGQSAKLSVISQGHGFGEMALLTCSPRLCSVNAKTDVTLLRLYKSDFEEIINMDSAFSKLLEKRSCDYSHFNQFKTLQPFALLPPEKMDALIEKLSERTFSPGDNIITQGEEGDYYYIIKSGSVSVLKDGIDNKPEQVAVLQDGEGFGEEALITAVPRNATVNAIDKTIVWTLSKEDFDKIMKASFLEEVFQEDIKSEDEMVTFLDVRMKMEFDEEHIPDALNIPLDELRKSYADLDSGREYYVYCLAGARSASAVFLLRSQGFNAKSIRGGLNIWMGPLVEGNDGIHNPFKPT